jgi:hypothetical protein
MRERVMRYDAQHWARFFIDDLILRPASEPVAAGTELGEARSQLLRALSEGKRIALFAGLRWHLTGDRTRA